MSFRSGLRLTAVLGITALLPLAASGAVAAHSPGRVFKGTKSVLTAAQVERLAAHATHRSIIIFKNQLTGLPARGNTANARIQAGSPVSWFLKMMIERCVAWAARRSTWAAVSTDLVPLKTRPGEWAATAAPLAASGSSAAVPKTAARRRPERKRMVLSIPSRN